MKHFIDRALVWFKDGDENCQSVNYKYYPLSSLYTRLLQDVYHGKKIKFINIHFKSEKTYQLYPKSLRYHLHFYNGHLSYNDVFDFEYFNALPEEQKKNYIWSKVHEIMSSASKKLGNSDLEEANEYAYAKGIERSLNADYRVLETSLTLYEQQLNGAIWYAFKEDGIHSFLVLNRQNKELYRKELGIGELGNQFFLVMYKRITSNQDSVTIEYVRLAETQPIRISIDRSILE